MPKTHRIILSSDDREYLTKVVSRASEQTRAHILLLGDEGRSTGGWTDADIAEVLGVNIERVRYVRCSFARKGLAAMVPTRPHRQLSPKDNEALKSIACERPPVGRFWTSQTLADELVSRGIVPEVSKETVWRALKNVDTPFLCRRPRNAQSRKEMP